jgi:hypothetical protein
VEHQTEASSGQATLLLLGTGHWSNPNQDLLNTQHDDMLASARQREMQECLDRLAQFRPTKVAIEVMTIHEDELNDEYRRYRAGTFDLTANERHQLGFRLAATLDHDRIYAVDWHDLTRSIGWETAFDFAREHNQVDLIGMAAQSPDELQRIMAEESARQRTKTVRQMLLDVNDPTCFWGLHRSYADLMRVGDGDCYVGADVIGRWYERNMRIFVNLTRITTSPDDRILVVIGAGHVYLLRHFAEGSGLYALELVESYLT